MLVHLKNLSWQFSFFGVEKQIYLVRHVCSPAYICDISEAGSAEGRTMGRQWLTLHNTLCSRWKDNLLPKKINKIQVQTNTKTKKTNTKRQFSWKTLLRAAKIIQMEVNLKTLKKLVLNRCWMVIWQQIWHKNTKNKIIGKFVWCTRLLAFNSWTVLYI